MLIKFKMVFAFSLFSLFTFAQQSNPYHLKGLTLANDLKNILPDIEKENLSTFNQAKIDEYKKKFATEINISEAQIADYLSVLKNNTKNGIIDNTSYSKDSKNFLKQLISGESVIGTFNFDTYNSAVINSSINEKEKELILTLSAIQYNLMNTEFKSKSAGSDGREHPGCDIEGTYPPVHLSPVQCALIVGSLGAVFGAPICGFPCAVGGFVIGFVATFFGTK